eukprot:CAMPEP_0198288098 /NCGR_PEP_ID=MMETSP1449-20131203/6724_1 /TAXON_ID=420275 /ORGANISM="Attheya septentrionalis, Strain CCMP2084" /LENGTH=302 /DNA_ID=CAMNT_0043986197 /DNA_START=167 /DNA_END=1071 /DNA_ORIENTATION=+
MNNRDSSRGYPHSSGSMHSQYAPPVHTIHKGTVVRVEPYGAFIQLMEYKARGLVHISQLASFKVEKVEDAVSMNDVVWVKVLEVTQEMDEETGKRRHKVRLSMKYAAQEDGADLDPDQSAASAEAERKGGGDFGGGGPASSSAGAGASRHMNNSSAMAQSLNSTIGMGIAIDPMQQLSSKGGRQLVLRQGEKSAATIFNGYALVDDDEGESDVVVPPIAEAVVPMKPLGRGRGTTLPAWMTRPQEETNGPVGRETSRSRSSSRENEARKRKHGSSRHHSSSRRREDRTHRKRKSSSSRHHHR